MGAIASAQRRQDATASGPKANQGDPRRQRRDRRRRVHRHRRALGLRQEHAAAHGGRAGGDHRRRDRHRRARGQRPRAGRARHRDGVPELRAVPAHERVRQHGLRAEDRQGAAGRDRGARATRRPRSWSSGALLERKPRELSGGQRQRVAMGRAIVRQPQVFLFDEPLSNLDAKLRAQTRLEIQKLHRELGVTSLFVTHDQVEAMTLAQRMIVMNAGRMEQIGTPEEVYARPATTFVAGFIGSPPMNLLQRPGRRLALHRRRPDAAAAGGGAAQRRADPRPAARARRAASRGGALAAAGGDGRDAGRRAPGLRPPGRRRCSPCASTPRCAPPQAGDTRARCTCAAEHLHWFDAATRPAGRD